MVRLNTGRHTLIPGGRGSPCTAHAGGRMFPLAAAGGRPCGGTPGGRMPSRAASDRGRVHP